MQYQDLLQIFPYNDEIYRVFVNGEQLKRMVKHILRDEAFEGDHTEFYQFSRGFRIEYDRTKKELVSLSLNGYEIRDFDQFKLGLQAFHLKNIKKFLDVAAEEISTPRRPKVLSTNSTDVLEEYFSHQELIRGSEERRLVFR